jgi:hypothetical protein
MKKKVILFVFLGGLLIISCSDMLVGDSPSDDPVSNFEIFWKDFDTRYSYFIDKDVDWDSVYTVYRPKVTSSTTDEELFGIFGQMIRTLKDGHVNLYAPEFGEQAYEDWYKDKPRNVVPAEPFLSRVDEGSPFVTAKVSGSIGYIRIITFGQPNDAYRSFEKVLNSLGDISALIIDLRDNAGGSTINSNYIAGHFTASKFKYGFVRYRNGPAHTDFTKWIPLEIEPTTENPYLGSVALLTNRRSFSSAEDFILSMKTLPNVTQIGDTTGGGSGNPVYRELPNGWNFRLSTWQMVDLNMDTFEGRGLEPQIPIWITEEVSLFGRDRILLKAIEYLEGEESISDGMSK